MSIALEPLTEAGIRAAQQAVTIGHYLHKPVATHCRIEGYAVLVAGSVVGYLVLGRPQATRCKGWYGNLADMQTGWAQCTSHQVLNLPRVYLDPAVQVGGTAYSPTLLPGFWDRHGIWHSTLASTAIQMMVERVGFDYLCRRPPCFPEEPYEIIWLLSYCQSKQILPPKQIGPVHPFHRGIIYQAAGFELHRTNKVGIQTWRLELPGLTPEQDRHIQKLAAQCLRSKAFRAKRAARATQLCLFSEKGSPSPCLPASC